MAPAHMLRIVVPYPELVRSDTYGVVRIYQFVIDFESVSPGNERTYNGRQGSKSLVAEVGVAP
jgi:hypothetical protein